MAGCSQLWSCTRRTGQIACETWLPARSPPQRNVPTREWSKDKTEPGLLWYGPHMLQLRNQGEVQRGFNVTSLLGWPGSAWHPGRSRKMSGRLTPGNLRALRSDSRMRC